MKRIAKIILIIYITLLIDIVHSCCPDKALKFRWTDLNLKNLDNSGRELVETSSKYISKKAYGIRVEFQEEQIANNFNPEIISSARAICYDDYVYVDTIEYIKVLANTDFNESHHRGTDLSGLFKGIIPFHHNYYDDMPKSIDQIILDLNQNDYQQYLSGFDLFLLYEPKFDSVYCFTIEMGLNNNRVLASVTDTVFFK